MPINAMISAKAMVHPVEVPVLSIQMAPKNAAGVEYRSDEDCYAVGVGILWSCSLRSILSYSFLPHLYLLGFNFRSSLSGDGSSAVPLSTLAGSARWCGRSRRAVGQPGGLSQVVACQPFQALLAQEACRFSRRRCPDVCAATLLGGDQPGLVQQSVGACHGVPVDPQLGRQLAHGGELVALLELAVSHQFRGSAR